jgi:hypothetical protein
MRHGPHWDCQTAKRPDVGSLPLHHQLPCRRDTPRWLFCRGRLTERCCAFLEACALLCRMRWDGEVLYKHYTSNDSCFPHQAKNPESWLSGSSFSYFLSRCQRLGQNPISASLPFRPRLSALCSSQEFLSPIRILTKLSILV